MMKLRNVLIMQVPREVSCGTARSFYSWTEDRCPEFGWKWRLKGALMGAGSRKHCFQPMRCHGHVEGVLRKMRMGTDGCIRAGYRARSCHIEGVSSAPTGA